MKPGDLERHLRRLVEVARHARERLSAAQDGLDAIRRDAASLAVSPDGEPGEPGGSRDAHEHQRRDRGESAASDRSRREVDSK